MNLPISVIVPIYNAGYFLPQCIESILVQTCSNFELLLIDDGSTDTSLEICTRYAKTDKRISVFHKENEGVTATRRYGVKKAKGKYICFVDADDELPKNSLFTLLDNSNDFDIVIGTYKEIDKDKEIINIFSRNVCREFDGLSYIQYQLENILYHAPWGKLIKKNCFDDTTLDIPRAIFRGEDYIMNIRLGLSAKRIKIIDMIVYYYMIRDTSCMQTRKPSLEYEKLFDDQLTGLLEKHNLQTVVNKSILYQRADALIGLILAKVPLEKSDPFIKTIIKEIKMYPFELKLFLIKNFITHPTIFRLLYKVSLKAHIL